MMLGIILLGSVACQLSTMPSGDMSFGETLTPIQPAFRTITNSAETPTPPKTLIRIENDIPAGLSNQIHFTSNVLMTDDQRAEAFGLGIVPSEKAISFWVYALVAPFPTVEDGISLNALRLFWQGEGSGLFEEKPLLVNHNTLQVFSSLWGKPAKTSVQEIEENLLEYAWQERPSWAIIPFEQVNPRWKVLRIDDMSPFDRNFSPIQYPLTIPIGWKNEQSPEGINVPSGNYDSSKMTTLIMTGTTALVRATGAKMEKWGMDYPARDIDKWLREADLTHISNEVSFEKNCPPADPYQKSLIFCSRPEYIELLEIVGTDIVELTGNHLMDWRRKALLDTLELYDQHGMKYYGAGENLDAARRPLLIEHNGNRLAFLGCNLAGPPNIWATDEEFGIAPCQFEVMKSQIQQLCSEEYLPIVTLQHFEYYVYQPTPAQQRDFGELAEAGAVIVSGSQGHYPQAMTFVDNHFIHYALGNLFFDQMYMANPSTQDIPVAGTRREFIDRHIFYDGKYIGTELLTALLEDFARPRPMTAEERRFLLEGVFKASDW
jgi:poly-gamma-glutamate capsule biosynthesis protein CapA/YwtB (metallophosphatase superfamily)